MSAFLFLALLAAPQIGYASAMYYIVVYASLLRPLLALLFVKPASL